MLIVSTNLPASENWSMQPVERPQVVKAEAASNMVFLSGICGSMIQSRMVELTMNTSVITTME